MPKCANTVECTCSYPSCSRHGQCCECLAYHLNMQELPACAFPPAVEKTYDRSYRKFVQTFKHLIH